MVDVVDKATRSRMMSGIKGKNTKPELIVRRYLHGRGLRYQLHVKRLPGTPDMVFPRYRAVVFVHGCFWHQHLGCRYATIPKTRQEFWVEKLTANRRRDLANEKRLEALGWRVLTIWECEACEAGLARLVMQITENGES